MTMIVQISAIRTVTALAACVALSAPLHSQSATRTPAPTPDRAVLAETQRQQDSIAVHFIRHPKGKPAAALRAGDVDELQRLKRQESSVRRATSTNPETPLAIRSDSAATQLRRKGSRAAP
jgi:hypothetical protein